MFYQEQNRLQRKQTRTREVQRTRYTIDEN